MKPYPRYKPTGLDWLPSVPEHWEVVKLRNLVKQPFQYGANASGILYDSEMPRYIRITDIDENGTLKTSGMQSLSWDDAQPYMLADGDVLFARSGATAGKSFLFRASLGNCCFAGYLIRCKPNQNRIASEYLSYYSLSSSYKNWLGRSTIQATIQNVSAEKYKEMPLPLPPPSEQDRIVRYLDEKTAAVDELVRAKEREIELLRERKQALVSAAVTGREEAGREGRAGQEGQAAFGTPGTSGTLEASSPSRPSCPASPGLCDSGVPWIGKIPKGWNVVKLSRRYSVQLGKMLDAKKIKGQSLMPYLRNQDVQWEGVNSEDLPKMDFSAEEQVRFGVRKGDLLVCEGGEIGRCAIWDSDKPCCFQKAIIRLRPRKPAEDFVRFMWYLMFAATANHAFDFATGKATIAHLPAEKLSAAQFAFPPLPEQERIVAHLDSVCSELDAAEAAIRKQIALLQELRTRLVSDAVTGAMEVP